MALSVQPAASGRDGAGPGVDLLVVAPHPDDEALLAAGLLARAAGEGRGVAVAIVTNGDFTCERDGYVREGESVAALGVLGVREHNVFFLGYPDGHLAELGAGPLSPLERRDEGGACVRDNHTYGRRGFRGADLHSALTGERAAYEAASLTSDLVALLERLRPRDVIVAHPADDHLDHAFTYAYLRRALERSRAPVPRVHRGLVHAGACWPTGEGAEPCPEVRFAPGEPMPPLPGPLARYAPSERFEVTPELADPSPERNLKYLAIASYRSQTGPSHPLSYLFSFARSDEAFFPETLRRDEGGALRRTRAPGAPPGRFVAGSWAVGGAGATLSAEQRAPLRCDVVAAVGAPGGPTTLRVLARAEGGTAYGLRVEADGAAVTLLRQAGEGASPLRAWPLPDDGARRLPHRYELSVDPRPDDGGVAELTVRRDGDVLGVAVDPAPLLDGDSVTVEGPGEPRRLASRVTCRSL